MTCYEEYGRKGTNDCVKNTWILQETWKQEILLKIIKSKFFYIAKIFNFVGN